ncbi:MAG: methyltransferase domain-containing protein [Pseudomonadota bacterium]
MKVATLEAEKPIQPDDALQDGMDDVRALLSALEPRIVKQAWFTMAHLILDKGSRVLDKGCKDGAAVYAMALMNPDHHFIGLDRDARAIKKAKDKYKLPNLEYMSGDVTENFLQPNSLDAVINSFNLHETYSRTHCSEQAVQESLERHMSLLKDNGLLFIRDYAMPNPDDYVILEMPEEPGKGDGIHGVSEVDLLIQFSEQARAREDPIHGGFYLEDLPPRFPRTRRFRLPHKWAYEFVIRKDDRDKWNDELHTEYTFYTERDYRKTLRALGARVLYTAPHWDEEKVAARFDKKFRLYNEDLEALGPPPTSFIALAQKTGEKKSLVLTERRPSRQHNGRMTITAMRDDENGGIIDVVSRNVESTEVIPYYVTPENTLRVFVHEGIPRALTNTVPRFTSNLDGKKWSGHMTEAIALPNEVIHEIKPQDRKSLVLFTRDYLGLKPADDAELEDGPALYPAPDYIDERIETKYLRVDTEKNDFEPRKTLEDIEGFSTKGRVRDVDAQDILNAAGVGLLPTCRLEVQIMALYEKLGIPYMAWADCPLTLKEGEPKNVTRLQKQIHKLAEHDDRYQEIKGSAGQIKTVNSIFVEEGQAEGGITGLASRDMEFVMQEDTAQNVAVVLPLTKKINGEVMAGIVETYLPVPQRYKGNGYMISCPSYPLPRELTNFEMVRKYIADKFEVKIENVARMGEGYFTHIGVTPQRIYPFAVTTAGASGYKKVGRTHGPCQYTPLYDLCDMLYLDNYYSFLKVSAMAITGALGQDSMLSAKTGMEPMYSNSKSLPVSTRTSEISMDNVSSFSKKEPS